MNLKDKQLLFFLVLSFFIPLFVYIKTLAPSVTFGDSGELISAAYFLGISHPPGSPLWTILAKLFTFLPINSIAWRVNLSSAFFSAIASSLFFIVQYQMLEYLQVKMNRLLNFIIILLTTLFFSFSKTVWTVSVIAERWTFSNLIFIFFMLFCLLWVKKREKKYLFFSSLMIGLGLVNHYLFLILIPPFVVWLLIHRFNPIKEYKTIFIMIVFLLMGLSFYLYLLFRAQAHPAINWGDPSNISSFISYIQRKQFSASIEGSQSSSLGGVYLPISRFQSISEIASRLLTSAQSFFISLNYEFPPWFLIASIVGFFIFLINAKQHKLLRAWFFFLLFFFLCSGWGFAFITNLHSPAFPTTFTHYSVPFIILCLWLGFGLARISERLISTWRQLNFIIIALLISFFFLYFVANYNVCDWSQNTIAYDHGKNILDTVDKNAIIVADKNDWVFPLFYLAKVEHMRPDVTIYDRTGNLFELIYQHPSTPIHSEADLEKNRQIAEDKIAQKFPERPFYYAADKNFENFEHFVTNEGILYKNKKFPVKKVNFSVQYKDLLSINKHQLLDDDGRYMLSYYHLRFGDELLKEKKEAQALSEYKKAYEFGKSSTVALNNVATIYVRLGKLEDGIQIFKEVLSANPDDTLALSNLAESYELRGDDDLALSNFERLNTLHVKLSPSIVEKIVRIYYRKGDCDKADKLYSSIQTLLNPQILNNIGICYAQKNNLTLAKQHWEKALSIDQFYKPARDNLKKLENFHYK